MDGLGERCCIVLGEGEEGGLRGDVMARGDGRDEEAEAAEMGRGGGMGCCSCCSRGDILVAEPELVAGLANRAASVISLVDDEGAMLEAAPPPLTSLSSRLEEWPVALPAAARPLLSAVDGGLTAVACGLTAVDSGWGELSRLPGPGVTEVDLLGVTTDC